MKQSVVEWLIDELNNIKVWTKNDIILSKADVLIDQAKEMEKQQIIDAYGDGLNAHRTDFCNREDYYQLTFKKK